MNAKRYKVISVHPETPDETLLVSNSERRDFASWQGNRGVVRRRTTGTPHKQARRLTQPGRKRALSGWKLIIISLLVFLAVRSVAAASGLFGPPQSISKDTGGLHTGIGYWYHEDKYNAGADYVARQKQLYSEVGYGTKNYWDMYARLGISNLNVSDAFSSASAATTTFKNDFEENMNYFGTLGAKAFYPSGKIFGIGAFIQGTYYFRDFTDDVSGTQNGAPFTIELRVKNLWDVNFGIGFQATVPYGIKMYLGPYVYYSEAKASPSANITGLALASGEMTIKNKTNLGGFTGIEVPLAKGFRLNVEGQYSERLSAGAAVTYSY